MAGSYPINPGGILALTDGSRPYGFGVVHDSGSQVLSRYFTTLNPVSGSYFEIRRVEIAAGQDFEFETWISPNDASFYLVGDSQTNYAQASRIIHTQNSWGGLSLTSRVNQEFYTDGKLHKINISRVGSNVTVSVDGVLDASSNDAGEFLFDRLGGRFGGTTSIPSFSGIYADTKLWLNGDKNTGTLERHYKLDTDSNILIDMTKMLGADIWNSQPYVDANGATLLEEVVRGKEYRLQLNTGSVNNIATGMRVLNFQGLTVGETYLYTVEADRRVNLAAYNQAYQLLSDNRGKFELLFTAQEGQNRLYVCPIDGEIVTIKSSTVQKASGYGQAINVPASDRELYELNAGGTAWIGQSSGRVLEIA